jgi:hypothetical protein
MFKGIVNEQNNNMLFGIQLEKIKSGNMYTGEFNGFSMSDEIFLTIIGKFASIKIAEILLTEISSANEKRIYSSLQMCSHLLKQRSFVSLIKQMKTELCAYTGFEDIGVLLYDSKCNHKKFHIFSLSLSLRINNK